MLACPLQKVGSDFTWSFIINNFCIYGPRWRLCRAAVGPLLRFCVDVSCSRRRRRGARLPSPRLLLVEELP